MPVQIKGDTLEKLTGDPGRVMTTVDFNEKTLKCAAVDHTVHRGIIR